ncbi:MAG: response regulator [Treponema sp.]|jgi:PleD family two-component response regulator|nr:response regulator [Treponema sp.]
MMDKKQIILAVDDMPVNLATIKGILQNDFDMRLSKSPRSALTMLNTVKVDLILLDVEMPEMSGFEFLDKIKNNTEHPELKDIPVIFITSHATEDFMTRAVSGGAVDYMVKPVTPQLLQNKVRSAIAPAPSNG